MPSLASSTAQSTFLSCVMRIVFMLLWKSLMLLWKPDNQTSYYHASALSSWWTQVRSDHLSPRILGWLEKLDYYVQRYIKQSLANEWGQKLGRGFQVYATPFKQLQKRALRYRDPQVVYEDNDRHSTGIWNYNLTNISPSLKEGKFTHLALIPSLLIHWQAWGVNWYF